MKPKTPNPGSDEAILINNLYDAVNAYVKSYGGSIVVIGGVRTEIFPNDTPHKFYVSVGCLGKPPLYPKPKTKGKK